MTAERVNTPFVAKIVMLPSPVTVITFDAEKFCDSPNIVRKSFTSCTLILLSPTIAIPCPVPSILGEPLNSGCEL